MRITPNIIQGPFIGTEATIASSLNRNCVGLSGRIIDETKRTFTILSAGRIKTSPKDISIFHFNLSDGSVVEIDGRLLVGRPEERLKKSIKRLW
jgi:ribonuclease P protein subunit POP4